MTEKSDILKRLELLSKTNHKDERCCFNEDFKNTECPEAICAMEFPGGINAFLRFKAMSILLAAGVDLKTAAAQLEISLAKARKFKEMAVLG